MKKPERNYAFIDSNNLHLGIADLGWVLDYRKLGVYLREHYGVAARAYYFVGRMPEYENLYRFLESAGYTMKYKEVPKTKKELIKGNIDAELVLRAIVEVDQYDQTVSISSDGDFACLVEHLREKSYIATRTVSHRD